MIIFKRHRPNCVDGGPIPIEQYDSIQHLLDSEWLSKWKTHKNFSHFAKSDNYLMAVFEDGFEWWVLGTIKGEFDLPKWKSKYSLIDEVGKNIVVDGDKVASSCGDVVTLNDGRKMKNTRR